MKRTISLLGVFTLIFTFTATQTFANIAGNTLTAVTSYTPGETNTLTLKEWNSNIQFTPDSYYSRKKNVSLTLLNDTGAAGDFNLSYFKGVSSGWEISGPDSITGLAAGAPKSFSVEVLITNSYLGEAQTSTVVAVSTVDPSIVATATVISVSAENIFEKELDIEIGSQMNLGVEYDSLYFWVTSRGSSTSSNLLSKLNRSGNLVTQYIQATSSAWGWRDLAWDGVYLYASDSADVDIIDPVTGITNGSFPGPQNPNRALAYDPVKDHFWTANFGSDIYEFDRSGTIITQFPNSFSIYGMAWDDVSAGSPYLWIWYTGAVTPIAAQFDPVNGVYTGVSFEGINPPGGSPGGACFVPDFNGKTTFFGMHQATPDTIVGYSTTVDQPTVITEAAYPVTWDFAILKGSVNPNSDQTIAYFEYGLNTNYGFLSKTYDLGYVSGQYNVTDTSPQLAPNSTYHYRLVAYNSAGTNYGVDQVVNTPAAPVNMPAMWFQPVDITKGVAASQSATNYPFDARLADDFMYTGTVGYFSQVRWWTAEWSGVTPDYISPYAFNIYLYTNYSGGAGCYPTNIIQTWTVPLSECHEELFETNKSMYSYWADLSPAFMPQTNVHYWLCIQPAMDFKPQIGLGASAYDVKLCDAMQVFKEAGMPDWTPIAKDVSYVLYPVPEPMFIFVFIAGISLLFIKKRK